MTTLSSNLQRYIDGASAALNQLETNDMPAERRMVLLTLICETIHRLAPGAPDILVELLPRLARLGASRAAFSTFCACRHLCSYGEQATVLVSVLPQVATDAGLLASALQTARDFPLTFARPFLLASLAWGVSEPERESLLAEALMLARRERETAERTIALAYTLPYLPDPTRTLVAGEADQCLANWDLEPDQANQVRAFVAPYLAPSLHPYI